MGTPFTKEKIEIERWAIFFSLYNIPATLALIVGTQYLIAVYTGASDKIVWQIGYPREEGGTSEVYICPL